jgi:hypothetical protein
LVAIATNFGRGISISGNHHDDHVGGRIAVQPVLEVEDVLLVAIAHRRLETSHGERRQVKDGVTLGRHAVSSDPIN